MNNIIRDVVIFTVGAGTGAFAVNYFLKTKYEEIAQEEIDSIREFYKKEKQEAGNTMNEETTISPLNGEVSNYKEVVKKCNYKANDQRKNEIFLSEREAPMDDFPGFEDASANANVPLPEPYIISVEQYHEEMDHFSKLSIVYYNGDDTLSDEDEETISDITGTIGDEALLCFGEGSDDPDVVYVRNEKLSIDYEIVRDPKSYQEAVLGIVPIKKSRKKKVDAE